MGPSQNGKSEPALPRTATTGAATAEPDPAAAHGKVLRLADKGQRAQRKYRRLLDTTEASWRATYGASTTSGAPTRCRSTRWSRTAGYPDGS